MPHRIKLTMIQSFGEGIIDQPVRHPQQLGIVHLLHPVALVCTQIVGISKLAAQRFEAARLCPRLQLDHHLNGCRYIGVFDNCPPAHATRQLLLGFSYRRVSLSRRAG